MHILFESARCTKLASWIQRTKQWFHRGNVQCSAATHIIRDQRVHGIVNIYYSVHLQQQPPCTCHRHRHHHDRKYHGFVSFYLNWFLYHISPWVKSHIFHFTLTQTSRLTSTIKALTSFTFEPKSKPGEAAQLQLTLSDLSRVIRKSEETKQQFL